jgi:hypothetical protein
MHRLHPDGLLFALVLTALPACSTYAWPADSTRPSLAKVEVTALGIHEGLGGLRRDHATCGGFSTSEPGMEKSSCLVVKQAGEQSPGRAMLALAREWNFDVPGMQNRAYQFYMPSNADQCSSFVRPVMPPLVLKAAPFDLVREVAPRQRASFFMQPFMGTQRPEAHHESNDFDLLKSDEDNVQARSQVSPSGLSFDGVNARAAWAMFGRLAPHRQRSDTSEALTVSAGYNDHAKSEHYHWGGLLAQSLLFNVIENGFRAASDDQIRNLLAKKPFWHDYAASIRQFNMRRWNDGD